MTARSNNKKRAANAQGADAESNGSKIQPHQSLAPLLTSPPERLSAYKIRRDEFIYESIHPADIEKYEAEGWIVHKESKTRVRMKRLKTHDRLLNIAS